MWESAASALKWIIDTLLKKRKEDADRKRQKWLQVADYLEKVSGAIELTITDFKNGTIPYTHYFQLLESAGSFGDVLAQVYDENKESESQKAHEYREAFYKAVHIIAAGDDILLEAPAKLLSPEGLQLLIDLQSVAGQFRGVAMTLRATA